MIYEPSADQCTSSSKKIDDSKGIISEMTFRSWTAEVTAPGACGPTCEKKKLMYDASESFVFVKDVGKSGTCKLRGIASRTAKDVYRRVP